MDGGYLFKIINKVDRTAFVRTNCLATLAHTPICRGLQKHFRELYLETYYSQVKGKS
jgi:hypothetical protein